MNRFNSALIFYLLPAVAVCAVVLGSDYINSTTMQVCKHEYALCTSAPCLPHPGDPSKAVCACNVEQGTSMSSAPCNSLQPSTDATGVKTIYSTFSFKQFQDGKKAMKCPSGTPWTWCLNKQCTVDPTNPKRAICICVPSLQSTK